MTFGETTNMATERDIAKIKEAVVRRKKEVYVPVKPEMQLGFVHNNVDCIGCRACEIACRTRTDCLQARVSAACNTLRAASSRRCLPTR